MTARERDEARARLAGGATDVVVGTHALIQEGVRSATSAWPSSTRSTASGSSSGGG
jgi:hypothetical protein